LPPWTQRFRGAALKEPPPDKSANILREGGNPTYDVWLKRPGRFNYIRIDQPGSAARDNTRDTAKEALRECITTTAENTIDKYWPIGFPLLRHATERHSR
jgi:hypothetical protein